MMIDPQRPASQLAQPLCGLILAGGLATRMGGGDKPLIMVNGQSLLDRTIARLIPQVGPLVLNANGDPARFGGFGLPVAGDIVAGYGGPLVGILTGLTWMKEHAPGCRWLLSVAADTPLFPDDLAARLTQAVTAENARLAVARSGSQSHPVFGLWPVDVLEDLRRAVVDEGIRKMDAFTARYPLATVSWPIKPFDPFFNVNTPEDVVRLRLILADALPDEPPLHDSRPISVVVERRAVDHPWKTEDWRPVAVIAEPAPGPGWVELRRGDGFEQYLVNGLTLHAHRSDLESYRYNLTSGTPHLYVGLKMAEGGDRPPVAAIAVSAAPDEAQVFTNSGYEVAEAVAMPADLAQWLEIFCACHPAAEPMRKRKRDKVDVQGSFARRDGAGRGDQQ